MTGNGLSIHSIVCPTDFSEPAASALAEAMRLAKWFGSTVTVLHVIPFTASIAPGDLGQLPIVAPSESERRAVLDSLRRLVEETEHAGVPVSVVCREGDVRAELARLVRETSADLVVMGTHGRSGFRRMVLGSMTEAVLDHPPAPVLAVNRACAAGPGLYRTVLCALDVSESSAGTLAVALAMAGDDAKRLTVLNVIDHGLEAFRGVAELTAMAALHDLVPDDARSTLRIDERVAVGEPDREILVAAEVEGADLIVLGTRGRGALAHLVAPTVRRVIRAAPCPVLVVPAGFAWQATGLVARSAG